MVLICMSLVNNSVEPLLMCLLAFVCLWRGVCLFKSFVFLKVLRLVFLLLSVSFHPLVVVSLSFQMNFSVYFET